MPNLPAAPVLTIISYSISSPAPCHAVLLLLSSRLIAASLLQTKPFEDLRKLCRFYEHSHAFPQRRAAQQLVLAMVEEGSYCRCRLARGRAAHSLVPGFTLEDVERVPFGKALPLREALRSCRSSPPGDWPPPAYALVGRPDIAQRRCRCRHSIMCTAS